MYGKTFMTWFKYVSGVPVWFQSSKMVKLPYIWIIFVKLQFGRK
jgi:hypothetical protein